MSDHAHPCRDTEFVLGEQVESAAATSWPERRAVLIPRHGNGVPPGRR
ncbi:hypothetical protein ACFSHR_18910 [Azotobacter chroococcum]